MASLIQDEFQQHGFISSINIFSKNEVCAITSEIKILSAIKTGRLSSITRINPHLLSQLFWDIVHDKRILDIVEKLIGPDIYCFGSSVIDKPADSSSFVACHQDATFWGLSKPVGATVWIALVAANKENGGMYFVKGSHSTQLAHRDTNDDNNMLGAREAVVRMPKDCEKSFSSLESGQISIHHPLVLHGSPVNLSSENRLAFVVRYIPASVRAHGSPVTLVRGENLSEMMLLSPPEEKLSCKSLHQHTRTIKQMAEVIRANKMRHLAEFKGCNNG